jgi:hypothetical protein
MFIYEHVKGALALAKETFESPDYDYRAQPIRTSLVFLAK